LIAGPKEAPALASRAALASGWGWAAIAVTAAFIAVTCWWLSQDRGVPFGDAGSHLTTAIAYHDLLAEGAFGELWTRSAHYPPLTFLVGAGAAFVGGVNPWAPILGENVVYVSLLALGCYQTGRLVQGPPAGLLAVVFALGSPLLIEQFHVFMLDAPMAALVAVAVWLILASERFSRIGVAAAAGLVVGLGLLSKELFPLYLVGMVVAVLARGHGWRNWRGVAVFAGVAFAVAVPWYAVNLADLGEYARAGGTDAEVPARGKPPLLSLANLGWYVWAVLNGLLFAPLSAFVAVGVSRTVRRLGGWAPELLGGLLGAWLALSLTPHHDMRYAMPLIVFLAVLGTAWIVQLATLPRTLATAGLAVAVIAATLGATFGLGGQARIPLGDPVGTDFRFGIAPSNQITLYSSYNFAVSAPRREDDVLALLRAVRREGITGIAWETLQTLVWDPVLEWQGLRLFARMAGLVAPEVDELSRWDFADPRHALLIRRLPRAGDTPCTRLRDGSGIWFVRGDPGVARPDFFCPP
jgi:4-amino-4-deoxy-L-arabinose transferase-like glycosyltransferase